jgi:hypothetical protein
MNPTTRLLCTRPVLFLLLFSVVAACGDDDAGADAGGNDRDAGPPSDAARPDAGPLPDGALPPDAGSPDGAIVIVERVFLPEGRFYYLSLRREVPTAPLDRSMAREFASADVEVYNGFIYIRHRTDNTVTRYSVSPTLELVEEESFSFALTGLGTGRVRNAFVSPTQAYALDAEGWRLIEWNPTTMELTGTEIDVSSFEREGAPEGFFGKPVITGGRAFAPVGWSDSKNLEVYPNMGVMILDGTGAPTLIEDERVGGGFLLYGMPDGSVFAPGLVGGDIRLFGSSTTGDPLPHDGMVRIAPGASDFDPEFFVDVSDISGSPGVWAIHRIDDTHVLAQLWDPAVPISEVVTIPDEYYEASNFIYVLIDTEALTYEPIDSIPRGGIGNAFDHVVDGTLYIQTSIEVAGESASSVHALTADGTHEVFTVPSGDLWHLERVR